MKLPLFGYRWTLRGDVIYGYMLQRDVFWVFVVLCVKVVGATSSEVILQS